MAAHVMAGIGGKGGTVVGVIWFENVLTYVLVGARVYTRRYIRGSVGWDDLCLVITSLLMTVFAILTTISCAHGMGQHVEDLETYQFSDALLYLLCAQSVVSMAIGMGKVTVAVFLLRIVTASWHRWFLWFCIASMMILSTFLSIAWPLSTAVRIGTWFENLGKYLMIILAYAAAMDFALAAFPWIALRGLKMKRKERISICVSLSLGVFAGVCGVIRTSGLEVLSNSRDYLYATSDSVIWTASEVTTTIVCVTLPALRPLYNKVRGQESSSAGYQQHDDSAYNTGGSFHMSSYANKRKDTGGIGYPKGSSNFASAEASRDPTTIKNDSDETILLQGEGKNIMRVQEVSVSYDNGTSLNNVSIKQDV
ncbi:hypothetical protein BHE90_008379 [Fusarium euwallaceae]|uniref:Rhodopsin domain-containing protein n=2 Tax=Fusarium solani species complex TaxID=232080 RepID=A0A430LN97_9HYPO|nr:hypothetical protein CDV31_004829 [Fusarium ambrosium]RTE77140.1 hypothetical protein BHE90_008379 [Fusarium euwallaceae]